MLSSNSTVLNQTKPPKIGFNSKKRKTSENKMKSAFTRYKMYNKSKKKNL